MGADATPVPETGQIGVRDEGGVFALDLHGASGQAETVAQRKGSFLKYLALGLVGLAAVGGLYVWLSNEPPPVGKEGPAAQRLAEKFMAAARMDRWPDTGAITWNFAGRRTHLWDRQRGFAQVKWEGHDVLLRLQDQTGEARNAEGKKLADQEAQKALRTAYEAHINDAFWLNPFASFQSEGVRFATVVVDGEDTEGLLVSYPYGGVTPKDQYLWLPGPDGLPKAFKMWVQIVPVGGMSFTWEDFRPVETGVLISRRHSGPKDFEITAVRAARSLAELLDGPDPFEPLVSTGPASGPARGPASAP